MKDITHSIEKAISQDVLWRQGFLSVINKLRDNGYIISFWENEENWTTILLADGIIGYIWEKVSISFY